MTHNLPHHLLLLHFMFALLLSLSILSCVSARHYHDDDQYTTNVVTPVTPAPFFIMALQWPASVCNGGTQCPPLPGVFTIHGYWANPELPPPCPGFLFSATDPDFVSTLEKRMDKSWINAERKGGNENFWTHEWTKHGNCSGIQDPNEYFEEALDVYDEFVTNNITGQIKKWTTPGTPVDRNKLLADIKSKYGVDFDLVCNEDGQRKKQLKEIRVYFSRNPKYIAIKDRLKFMNFPATYPKSKTCGNVAFLMFPSP